jgi:hypothetical protein
MGKPGEYRGMNRISGGQSRVALLHRIIQSPTRCNTLQDGAPGGFVGIAPGDDFVDIEKTASANALFFEAAVPDTGRFDKVHCPIVARRGAIASPARIFSIAGTAPAARAHTGIIW